MVPAAHTRPELIDLSRVGDATSQSRIRATNRARDLVAWATLRPSGVRLRAPITCTRRPNRQPCATPLEVFRQDLPHASVQWWCPCCFAHGRVRGFEGLVQDLRFSEGPRRDRTRPPSLDATIRLPLDRPWYERLRHATRTDPDSCQLLARAELDRGSPHEPKARLEGSAREFRALWRHLRDALTSSRPEPSESPSADGGLETLIDRIAASLARATGYELPRSPQELGARTCESTGEPLAGTDGTHQLRATATDLPNPAWRRLEVPSDTDLELLHAALQIVFGWHDRYEHWYSLGGRVLGPDPGPDELDSHGTVLGNLFERSGAGMVYEYLLPDSPLTLEVTCERVSTEPCPDVRCVDGEGFGPGDLELPALSLTTDERATLDLQRLNRRLLDLPRP